MGSRTIFIGDVHGCFRELLSLVAKLRLHKSDRVIFLGDLVNKGPEVEATVDWVWRSGHECLAGNHEIDFLRHHDRDKAYRSLWRGLPAEQRRWMGSLPSAIEDGKFIAVHAGLAPGVPIHEQKREHLVSLRFWPPEKGEGGKPWHAFYAGKRPVVYGHWAKQGLSLGPLCFGLDTGCVYGGKLTAWILETGELVQVEALRQYVNPIRKEKNP